jgi:hypothetical protein
MEYAIMSSQVFAPDTPTWLSIIVLVLTLGTLIVLLVLAMILEIQYTSPFILNNTENKEKWRRATILALMQTAMIPIFGIVQPILSPHSGQFPMFTLICSGIWVAVLPVSILLKRLDFETHIIRYKHYDKRLKDKNGIYSRRLSNPFFRIAIFFMAEEHKRFYREGFPDDVTEKEGGKSSGQKSNIKYKNES